VTTTATTKLVSSDARTDGGRATVFDAVLTLQASSLQQVVQADVPLDAVSPASLHSDDVSFICTLHDTLIVQILLIDSFSLTSAVAQHRRYQCKERKSFPSRKTHRAALISVSLALSQTPVYTARPRIRG